MNRQGMRVVVGINLVTSCILLQGCGMFGKKTEVPVTVLPAPAVEVQPVAPVVPVESDVVEQPVVQSTTAYAIQKGDTISGVAYKFNLRWQDVMAINPGINPKHIRIGQVIQLPGQVDLSKARTRAPVKAAKTIAPKVTANLTGAKTTYVVKAGDSLSTIAHRHGMKTVALREANGLTSDRISVGQKLILVGAKTSAAGVDPTKGVTTTPPKTDPPKTDVVEPVPVSSGVTTAPAGVVDSPVVKIDVAAPPALNPNVQTYTVKEGEDLYQVAIRWGASPSDLKALNNLTSSELKAGTVLKIPGSAQ